MPKPTHKVASAFYRSVWAMEIEKLKTVETVVHARLSGVPFTRREIYAALSEDDGGDERPRIRRVGSAAILSVYGMLTKRQNMMTRYSGGTSVDLLAKDLRAAAQDESVETIILDCNSPGGEASGVADCADVVRDVSAKKRVIAVANDLMASGAYWICSAATEVVATQTAVVGSIGVYSIYQDYEKALEEAGIRTNIIQAGELKTAGNEYREMSDAERAAIQTRVNDVWNLFVSSVAQNRKVSLAQAKSWGDGNVHYGTRAVDMGLVDRISTLEEVVATVAGTKPKPPARSYVMPTNATDQAAQENPAQVDGAAAAAASANASASTAQANALSAAAEKRAREEEQTRVLEIQSICRAIFGKSDQAKAEELATAFIRDGLSIEKAQAAITKELVKDRSTIDIAASSASGGYGPFGGMTLGASSLDKFYAAAQDAILIKTRQFDVSERRPDRAAFELSNYSLADIARQSLRLAGVDTTFMSKAAVCENALKWEQASLPRGPQLRIDNYGIMAATSGSIQSTGDFPGIFRDAANKLLMRQWELASGTWRQFVRRAPNVPDFKEINRLKVSEIPMLEIVKEDDDIPLARMSEERESYRPARYAKGSTLTLDMMLNDDLNAFAQLPAKLANGADRTINYLCYAELMSNRTMGDGVAVFGAGHNNDLGAGTGGAPSHRQMSLVRQTMRVQRALQNTDDGGIVNNSYLNLEPKLILVPPVHEEAAMLLQLSDANPDQTSNVPARNAGVANIYRNKFTIISDAELAGSAGTNVIWYALCDPGIMPAVEISFVDGYDTPVIEEMYDFHKKGRIMTVQLIFGARWVEWRSAVRNVGA